MISRIIMDKSVLACGKAYVSGMVYDSRIPHDSPAASDGIQHHITEFLVGYFIAKEWAHEETWGEWGDRVEQQREKQAEKETQ